MDTLKSWLKKCLLESCGGVPTPAHTVGDPATTQPLFPICDTILSAPDCQFGIVATGNELKSGLGEVEQLKV